MKSILETKVGDIITLKDEQTLIDQADCGGSLNGLDLVVSEVLVIREAHNVASWTRIRFKDSELVMVIKKVDSEFDIRICFPPEGYEAGNRRDLEEHDVIDFFFDDVEGGTLEDLEYSRSIFEEDEDGNELEYAIKGGSLYGEDSKGRFCTITEWKAIEDCENPEIIVFEIGGEDGTDGGYIDMYQGINLNPEDYERMDV